MIQDQNASKDDPLEICLIYSVKENKLSSESKDDLLYYCSKIQTNVEAFIWLLD